MVTIYNCFIFQKLSYWWRPALETHLFTYRSANNDIIYGKWSALGYHFNQKKIKMKRNSLSSHLFLNHFLIYYANNASFYIKLHSHTNLSFCVYPVYNVIYNEAYNQDDHEFSLAKANRLKRLKAWMAWVQGPNQTEAVKVHANSKVSLNHTSWLLS